MFANNKKNQ